MATTTTLIASNGFYGHSGKGSYTNSAANHLYAGKSSGTSNYRSRMTFQSLRSKEGIGDSRIAVTKIVLYVYRNDGGPTKVTAGASASNAWGASRSGTGSAKIAASTGWKSIDITACAEAVAGYTGNWYLHLTGDTEHRIRFDGTGSSHKPYIEVTWEYVAATIKSDKDSVELGKTVTLTITPEPDDRRFTLKYGIGDASGVIVENTDRTSVTVGFSPALATEIPDDNAGTVDIRMTVYGQDGAVLRTERYPLLVKVPPTVVPAFADDGAKLMDGLSGYALTGKSFLSLAPVIDMNNAYGAVPVSVTAKIVNGASEQTLTWTEFTETGPGMFTCAEQKTAVFMESGTVRLTLDAEDSRDMHCAAKGSWTVCEYAPPVIKSFSAQRYSVVLNADEEEDGFEADDLGGYVWINAAAAVSEVAPNGEQLNTLTWKIEAVNPATGESEVVEGASGQSLDLINNREIFPDAVSEGDTLNYNLLVMDSAGAIAAQYAAVQPGWANFALAACRRGAAFGGIPHGTVENPMLESWYTGYFYNGIHGVNMYADGEVETGGKWFGKPIYRRVFRKDVTGNATGNTELGTLMDVDSIVRMEGMFKRTVDTSLFIHPIPYYNSTTRYFLPFYNPTTGQVLVQATTDGTAHLIVDYTKYTPDEFRILVQPTDIKANAGSTVTFNVVAVGVVSYQWQVGGTDGEVWTDLTWVGAKSATMTHTMNVNNITYVYRCKLTGAGGTVLYTNTMRFI